MPPHVIPFDELGTLDALIGWTIFNACCSLLLLAIIALLWYDENFTIKDNIYIQLIIYTTICQMMYDVFNTVLTYFDGYYSHDNIMYLQVKAVAYFFGITSSTFCVSIIFSVFFMAQYRHKLSELFKNILVGFNICLGLSVTIPCLVYASNNNEKMFNRVKIVYYAYR